MTTALLIIAAGSLGFIFGALFASTIHKRNEGDAWHDDYAQGAQDMAEKEHPPAIRPTQPATVKL